jgi:hypothetical protein
MNTTYKAIPLGIVNGTPPYISLGDLDRLSLLANGIYSYLQNKGTAANIKQLGEKAKRIPYAAISDALDELIQLGLIAEVEEVAS